MKILITTDLHLTDAPQDEYRFAIFNFLKEKSAKYNCGWIYILGDLTDRKDNHSSTLTNRITKELLDLSKECPLMILKGNHDYYANPDMPFFKFLNNLDGDLGFVVDPTFVELEDSTKVFLVPHIRSETVWADLKAPQRPDYAFIHQTVTGAISETGRRLDGFSLAPVKRFKCPVFAGDVHKPHGIPPVQYVGPPYHIRFGDDYKPRCLLLDTKTGKTKNLYLNSPNKLSLTIGAVDEIKELDIKEGDQVKLTFELSKEEAVEWSKSKNKALEELKKLGALSFGVEMKVNSRDKREKPEAKIGRTTKDPIEVLVGFCNKEKLSKAVRKAGKDML